MFKPVQRQSEHIDIFPAEFSSYKLQSLLIDPANLASCVNVPRHRSVQSITAMQLLEMKFFDTILFWLYTILHRKPCKYWKSETWIKKAKNIFLRVEYPQGTPKVTSKCPSKTLTPMRNSMAPVTEESSVHLCINV